jgi:hypothetical protein
MKKNWKIIVLFLILLIPAGIYIFLQTFGQNEFTVPVYNSDGEIESIVTGTDIDPDQHMVSLDVLIDDSLVDRKLISEKVILLDLNVIPEQTTRDNYQINRLADIFRSHGSVHIIRIFSTNQERTNNFSYDETEDKENVSNFNVDYQTFRNIAKTQLGIELDGEEGFANQLVLLDENKRIRGYYNLNDFEDIDRLILEVKILLNRVDNV